MILGGYKGDAGTRNGLRSGALVVAALSAMLAGCGGTPVRGDLRTQPVPSAITTEQSAPATPATVVSTVVMSPLSHTVYRVIRVSIPKGVTSLSLTLPEDAMPELPPPAGFTPAPGGDKDCSEGFFSCSKLISETVTAVVAAFLALLGLYKVLRRKRGKQRDRG